LTGAPEPPLTPYMLEALRECCAYPIGLTASNVTPYERDLAQALGDLNHFNIENNPRSKRLKVEFLIEAAIKTANDPKMSGNALCRSLGYVFHASVLASYLLDSNIADFIKLETSVASTFGLVANAMMKHQIHLNHEMAKAILRMCQTFPFAPTLLRQEASIVEICGAACDSIAELEPERAGMHKSAVIDLVREGSKRPAPPALKR
jgi:hypothetical protein